MQQTISQKILAKIFKKYPQIISAYIFGSRARGTTSPISDYDFAVDFEKDIDHKTYINIKLQLIKDLSKTLKTDKIDLVIINEAPILLQHRILKDRKVLFCKSPLKRLRNEFKILTEYMDQRDFELAFANNVFSN